VTQDILSSTARKCILHPFVQEPPLTRNESKIILGNGAASGTKGAVYLGRPWGDYARVVFQNTDEGNMITSAGWERMFSLLFHLLNLTKSIIGSNVIQHGLQRNQRPISSLANTTIRTIPERECRGQRH
jgi:hypothetical protein